MAAVLGVADRPLPEPTVVRTLEVDPLTLASTLRELRDLQLLGVTDATVHLRHPLLAEAVRRRLLPGETVDAAPALGGRPGGGPGGRARRGRPALARCRAAGRGAHVADPRRPSRGRALRGVAVGGPLAARVGALAAGHARGRGPAGGRHEVVAGIATQLDLAGRPAEAIPVLEAELVTSRHVRRRRTSSSARPAGEVQLLTVPPRGARPRAERARHPALPQPAPVGRARRSTQLARDGAGVARPA